MYLKDFWFGKINENYNFAKIPGIYINKKHYRHASSVMLSYTMYVLCKVMLFETM